MKIPAYTISDVLEFTPVGYWALVAESDHTEVLCTFYNASWVSAKPIAVDCEAETWEAA